jgi:HSP20 family protein
MKENTTAENSTGSGEKNSQQKEVHANESEMRNVQTDDQKRNEQKKWDEKRDRQETGAGAGATFVPRVDLFETPAEIVLKCDLPGVAANDVDLHFEKGILTLHGKVSPRQRPGQNAHVEYGVGDFRRTFSIPVKVDATKLTAESSLGVLTVHLPKHEEAKPQKVMVKAI